MTFLHVSVCALSPRANAREVDLIKGVSAELPYLAFSLVLEHAHQLFSVLIGPMVTWLRV